MQIPLEVPGFFAGRAPVGPAHAQLARAITQSRTRELHGLPYPIQFRNQDAFSAWRAAMEGNPSWPYWNDPTTSCHDVRSGMRWHIDRITETLIDPVVAESWRQGTRFAPLECSTSLVYALRKGTLIESTPALESLLLNSDIDQQLPLSMLALPYPAQYIRFGDDVGGAIRLPDCPDPGHELDGVFCFQTPPSSGPNGYPTPRLEFIFIATHAGRYLGHISLLGSIENSDMPVMEWLAGILSRHGSILSAGNAACIRSALDYVAKLLLYLGLKQARVARHAQYSEGLERLKRVGAKKRGRHTNRLHRHYDRIEVGPEHLDLPQVKSAPAGGAGVGVSPHWRRGHFRMQPYGHGRQQRKMIYIPPVLVHASDLTEALQPKDYRVSLGAHEAAPVQRSAAAVPVNAARRGKP